MEIEAFHTKQLDKAPPTSLLSSRGPVAYSLVYPKHEVFISFSNDDASKFFASHVSSALARKGVMTYRFNDFEAVDDTATCEAEAIKDAKLSIIMFSKNYATSPKCLDELRKIIECSKKKKQIIVPVFYDVTPSIVRKQMGIFEEAFRIHEQNFKDDMEKVQSWRNALTEASSYSGWDCTINVRTEHEIVEEIAKDVLQKLDRVYVGDIEIRIKKLEQLAKFLESSRTPDNERNHKATLERIERLKMEKNFRMLRLTPDLLSHMEISKTTNTYF